MGFEEWILLGNIDGISDGSIHASTINGLDSATIFT